MKSSELAALQRLLFLMVVGVLLFNFKGPMNQDIWKNKVLLMLENK